MEIICETSRPSLPYDEIIPNTTLSRIFSHNLKEVGIIDIGDAKNSLAGISIGTVSHVVPCIHPYISITDDKSIKYSSLEFAKATVSNYAKDTILKAASALAMTGLDLLEKESLLQEVKSEFYKNVQNLKINC